MPPSRRGTLLLVLVAVWGPAEAQRLRIVDPEPGSMPLTAMSVSLHVDLGGVPGPWAPERWRVCYDGGLGLVCERLDTARLRYVDVAAIDDRGVRPIDAWLELDGARVAAARVLLWFEPRRALEALLLENTTTMLDGADYWLHDGIAQRQLGDPIRAAASLGRAQALGAAEDPAPSEWLDKLHRVEGAYGRALTRRVHDAMRRTLPTSYYCDKKKMKKKKKKDRGDDDDEDPHGGEEEEDACDRGGRTSLSRLAAVGVVVGDGDDGGGARFWEGAVGGGSGGEDDEGVFVPACESVDRVVARHASRMRLAFYGGGLSEQGTTVALFDYADLSECALGIADPFVLYLASQADPKVLAKFEARFGAAHVVAVDTFAEVDAILAQRGATHLILLKSGPRDGLVSRLPHVRTCVLAIFEATEPHGDRFARISPSIPTTTTSGGGGGDVGIIPFVVRRRNADGPDLRDHLGIPRDAVVFGRHGGFESFDIPAARRAALAVARRLPDVYFLFVNTAPLLDRNNDERKKNNATRDDRQRRAAEEEEEDDDDDDDDFSTSSSEVPPPNVIHLPRTADLRHLDRFIRTCDAMLHGRLVGETFGLAIAEFSVLGKPVITSRRHGGFGIADFHLRTLGPRGLYYDDEASLEILLATFRRSRRPPAPFDDWNAYRTFEPKPVMRNFARIFLDGLEDPRDDFDVDFHNDNVGTAPFPTSPS